jgi:hypothetical protein
MPELYTTMSRGDYPVARQDRSHEMIIHISLTTQTATLIAMARAVQPACVVGIHMVVETRVGDFQVSQLCPRELAREGCDNGQLQKLHILLRPRGEESKGKLGQEDWPRVKLTTLEDQGIGPWFFRPINQARLVPM